MKGIPIIRLVLSHLFPEVLASSKPKQQLLHKKPGCFSAHKIWKVKCNESKKEGLLNELIEWSAPSFITVGKLKKMIRKLAAKKPKISDTLVEHLSNKGNRRLNPQTLYASDKQSKKNESLETIHKKVK